MSHKGLLIVTLAFFGLIIIVPVMGRIGQHVGEIPQPTVIDVPSALKKTDTTFASASGTIKTATPSSSNY
jgi:hypothetical protein